ncbi:hypothetical protein AGMMS49940_23270 [Spirochaetia bacterium]|nr:hypothetical protein AGMMS49940_23270 [Spirochaetia bacterium]
MQRKLEKNKKIPTSLKRLLAALLLMPSLAGAFAKEITAMIEDKEDMHKNTLWYLDNNVIIRLGTFDIERHLNRKVKNGWKVVYESDAQGDDGSFPLFDRAFIAAINPEGEKFSVFDMFPDLSESDMKFFFPYAVRNRAREEMFKNR